MKPNLAPALVNRSTKAKTRRFLCGFLCSSHHNDVFKLYHLNFIHNEVLPSEVSCNQQSNLRPACLCSSKDRALLRRSQGLRVRIPPGACTQLSPRVRRLGLLCLLSVSRHAKTLHPQIPLKGCNRSSCRLHRTQCKLRLPRSARNIRLVLPRQDRFKERPGLQQPPIFNRSRNF